MRGVLDRNCVYLSGNIRKDMDFACIRSFDEIDVVSLFNLNVCEMGDPALRKAIQGPHSY
jgi:hypothetical protein